MLELGHGFYLFKCEDEEVVERALLGGPWVIAGNYLAVQRWKPGFCASKATINSMCVWSHIPDFPIEFFSEDLLFSVASYIGTPLKVDMNM